MKSNAILTKGQPVTYIDGLSGTHTRVAIRLGPQTFLTNIDNLTKPKSIGSIDLKPQAFGVVGRSFSITEYISTLRNNIKGRDDIKGELEEYLLDLVNSVEFGGNPISGYNVSEFPMGSIESDFGEALGPIHCIKRGLTSKGLGITQASTIFIPPFGSEPLVDYIIRNTSGLSVRVSAKGSKFTNTLKPRFIVPPIRENSILANRHARSEEFAVLGLLNDYSTNEGALRACQLLGLISNQAFRSLSNFSNQTLLSDFSKRLFTPIIQTNLNTKNLRTINLRQLSKLCEELLVKYSKEQNHSQKFTKIVNDVLNNDIVIVKLAMVNGVPSFTVSQSNDGTIANVYFRNKNSFNVGGEKLGFQL
tara:strand:- start:643 stop:1728 length:1086 start_codon:yes stop_codon:yes gene_type:complete